MTTGTGDDAAVAGAEGIAGDWKELRADGDIQFAPVEIPPPDKPPDWITDFLEWWGDLLRPVSDAIASGVAALARVLGLSAQAVLWIVLGLALLLALYILWRTIAPAALRRRAKAEAEPEWVPDAGEALALLEDADRLAAEGRYEEATHLLLKRSVGQISTARPGLLDPSSTAREIAALPALPQGARSAFAIIAERVERSLFALRKLSAEDWHAARAAYADFALAAPTPVPA